MDQDLTDDMLTPEACVEAHVHALEAAGMDPDSLTSALWKVAAERSVKTPTTEPEAMSATELLLLSIGGMLAKERNNGISAEANLLNFAAAKLLPKYGREELRKVLEAMATDLTCPADFWR